MWPVVETVLILAGLGSWIWAIKMYLDDPGYGGFDMNTAPAFDFRWFKGTLFFALGFGMVARSWLVGLATLVAGTAATLLVKPLLGTFATRRIASAARAQEGTHVPKGFEALSRAERDIETGNEKDATP